MMTNKKVRLTFSRATDQRSAPPSPVRRYPRCFTGLPPFQLPGSGEHFISSIYSLRSRTTSSRRSSPAYSHKVSSTLSSKRRPELPGLPFFLLSSIHPDLTHRGQQQDACIERDARTGALPPWLSHSSCLWATGSFLPPLALSGIRECGIRGSPPFY